MKKRLLALLLVVCICLSNIWVSAEDSYDDLTPEEQVILNDLMYKYYQSVMNLMIDAYSNGDITIEELYGAFIKELIGTDPEMVEKAVRAAISEYIFTNIPEVNHG